MVSYTTVSPLPRRLSGRSRMVHRGGLFSVALSRGSPRVAVSHHLALRSPDVPRRCALPGIPGPQHRRDRLTDSSVVQHRSSSPAGLPPRWSTHGRPQGLLFPGDTCKQRLEHLGDPVLLLRGTRLIHHIENIKIWVERLLEHRRRNVLRCRELVDVVPLPRETHPALDRKTTPGNAFRRSTATIRTSPSAML